MRTYPSNQKDSDETVNINEMTKVSESFHNGAVREFYCSTRSSRNIVDIVAPLFFSQPHGKRESTTYHRSGFIVSSTDIWACNAPVRRRSVFLIAWDGKEWGIHTAGSCSSIQQGKRHIENILKTGVIE